MAPSMTKIQRHPARSARPPSCVSCDPSAERPDGAGTYAVGQDAGAGRGEAAEHVEERAPSAYLVCAWSACAPRPADSLLTSRVPRAEQIDAAREEAGLEQAQHDAEASQLAKVGDEAHADRDHAPEQRDGSEVQPGADAPDEHRRRRLEDDVREEDEVGNVLAPSARSGGEAADLRICIRRAAGPASCRQ